jgi:hypothetical protein
MTGKQAGSVAIPAHNEEAVIGRCLHALFDAVDPNVFEVAVVCNGCTDRTADVVRRSGLPVQLIELERASKPLALRAADGVLRHYPRLYLDADVVVSGRSVLATFDRLRVGDVVAARPPIEYDTRHSTALVQRYYRARTNLPAVLGSLWGAGAYALSLEGRGRFGEYPEIVAEDLFVDRLFRKDEIAIVDCEPVRVTVPHATGDLVRITGRACRGDDSAQPTRRADWGHTTPQRTIRDLLRSVSTTSAALDAGVYAAIATAGRIRALHHPTSAWERDDSSRQL